MRRVSFYMREEILKFKRYQKQFCFLYAIVFIASGSFVLVVCDKLTITQRSFTCRSFLSDILCYEFTPYKYAGI